MLRTTLREKELSSESADSAKARTKRGAETGKVPGSACRLDPSRPQIGIIAIGEEEDVLWTDHDVGRNDCGDTLGLGDRKACQRSELFLVLGG
ncbi:unnamed protein product [Zymoseptoria tritici ST99CH_3D7]|nr:unnamed protein product [Zymoseptoria tritici ST99CH_3D7]SMR42674.1 unnamed protein product [Zymoseptoria tritici ST99CH_1E4]